MTSETIAKMRERGILYQGSMVKALLAGTKTNTRRIVKPQPDSTHSGFPYWNIGGYRTSWCRRAADGGPLVPANPLLCPYGTPGQKLWVRETFFAWGRWETRYSAKKKRDEWHFVDMTLERGHSYRYAETGNHPLPMRGGRDAGVTPGWWKRPAIFMPRAASRILLEITDTTAERLQDISDSDAAAEGLQYSTEYMGHWSGTGEDWFMTARDAYRNLWQKINGVGSWDANPLVWSVKFKVLA